MKYIIDRFEEDFAVCENEQGEYVNINRDELPADAKEGDAVIELECKFTIDASETKTRRERIRKLAEDLWI